MMLLLKLFKANLKAVAMQVLAQPRGFIRALNGAFVDNACQEFWPVGWNSCAHAKIPLLSLRKKLTGVRLQATCTKGRFCNKHESRVHLLGVN